MTADAGHRTALAAAWQVYADPRSIAQIDTVSPLVSTNEVYRLILDDGSCVYGKVSSYGSYFLFAEDHDRLYRCERALRGTRFAGFLAPVLGRDGRPFTWYDGRLWAAFYDEVPVASRLPARLSEPHISHLGREIAEFHRCCAEVASDLPPMSNSVKSDAIHLLDLLSSPFAPRNFDLRPEQIGVLWRHTHEFLLALERIRYDEWPHIPILVDWNLGNFSVQFGEGTDEFRLYSRWDYDWFRVESRLHDFYFLSRVSSHTGDRATWTYSPHTLVEDRFVHFVRAYHATYPLSHAEIDFLREAFRFFILHYVVKEGARFFRPELCRRFRQEAVSTYLPACERLDLTPLHRAIDGS